MTGAPTPTEESTTRAVPGHASTIVVPLSNPSTATDLLRLASTIAKPEVGRVIGLIIVLGEADAEANLERIEAFEEMIQTVRARDGRIAMELLTRPATSVARGILDVARDENADMILLGVQAPTPGAVTIGALTRQVIDTADCDVLVYRASARGDGLDGINGVVVGVDPTPESRVAARLGALIGSQLSEGTELLHVLRPGASEAEGRALIEQVSAGLEDTDSCTHRVVQADTAAKGLHARVPSGKLMVIGFHTGRGADGQSLGSTTRSVMDTVRGPVLAISRPDRGRGLTALYRRAIAMMRPRLTDTEEQSLVWGARMASTLTTDFIVLCVIAAVLATLGLLLNSAAVIIGAMLVAPLMSPIVAFGTALVDGEIRVLRRAASTIGIGVLLVSGTAVLLGLIIRPDIATQEMLSRGSPSLIDAGVAAASGMIGGYASARKGIPAALAGVAIAAALVPPICVFGLALTLDPRLAVGAGLLFVTNIACIAVASAAVLVWLGVHLRGQGEKRLRYLRFTAPVLVAVLGALVMFGLSGAGPDLGQVQTIVEQALPEADVVSVDTLGESGTITVTIRVEQLPDDQILRAAAAEVAEVTSGLRLQLAVQSVVQAAGQ